MHKVMQYIKEIKILQDLSHQFILNLHYAFQDRNNLYIIQDLIDERQNLNMIFSQQNQPHSESQAKFVAGNILILLEYIHQQNILHLGLTPEKIIIDQDGYLRIANWKTALHQLKQEQPYEYFTIQDYTCYTAPEILKREKPECSSDFYSLGLILYQIIVGKIPYQQQPHSKIELDQWITQLISNIQLQIKKSDLPEGWSLDAADFINKVIQRKPQNRIGYNGYKELIKHKWLKDIPWQKIKSKLMESPFAQKQSKLKFLFQKCTQFLKKFKIENIQYESDDELQENSSKIFSEFSFIRTTN